MKSERKFNRDWGEPPCCDDCEIENCKIPCNRYITLEDEQLKIIKELEDRTGFGKEPQPIIMCKHDNRLVYNITGEYGGKEKILICRKCWVGLVRNKR